MASDRPGGEPTEEPTPRRLKQARDEGRVVRSGDFAGAWALVGGVGALAAGGAWYGRELGAVMRGGLERAAQGAPNPADALSALLLDVARLSLPVLGAAAVAATVTGFLQTGGVFTLKPLAPQLERVNPVKGLARIFSAATLAELVKSVLKIVVVGLVAWWTLAPRLPELFRLQAQAPQTVLAWMGATGLTLLVRVAVAYAVIGAADYLWQRRSYFRELRMTREEVKREHKEQEGDPRHKAERQRLHRDLLRHSIIEAVRNADCVIVNPDHLAVALRYNQAQMGAPEVVAKGEELWAEQIKEVARQHGVPIYRDVPLARALSQLEIGDEIPEDLYDAVAEVLRFVYAHSGEQGENQ